MSEMHHKNENNTGVWDFVSLPGLESEEDYFQHHLEKYTLVKEVVETTQSKKILDIGVATGIFYSLFSDISTFEIHGIEINSHFIPVLQQRGIIAHSCNIEQEPIPCPDESFDLVICDSILEHTLKPKHLLEEIRRVLKPGGHFILVVPNATSIIRRWNFLRGRNVFWPLIDNLWNKKYMERCAVFYTESDLTFIIKHSGLTLNQITYLNEESHDHRSVSVTVSRIVSSLFPQLKDVIFVRGSKK